MRRTLTTLMVVLGLVLMAVGYFLSAPWGADSVENSDPRMVFAPAIFILGVITAFSAAIVYEVFPGERE